MAGYLPFDEADLTSLYRKINAADFARPNQFYADGQSLISRILGPDSQTRIKIREIRANEQFKKNYMPVKLYEDENVNLDDVRAVFDDAEQAMVPCDEGCIYIVKITQDLYPTSFALDGF